MAQILIKAKKGKNVSQQYTIEKTIKAYRNERWRKQKQYFDWKILWRSFQKTRYCPFKYFVPVSSLGEHVLYILVYTDKTINFKGMQFRTDFMIGEWLVF